MNVVKEPVEIAPIMEHCSEIWSSPQKIFRPRWKRSTRWLTLEAALFILITKERGKLNNVAFVIPFDISAWKKREVITVLP